MKHLNLTLMALLLSFISFAQAPGPIIGVPNLCLGSTTNYSDAVTGGVWTSSNTSVVNIDAVTGDITPIALGNADITYTTFGGSDVLTVTVNPLPAPIAGPSSVCAGATITLTDADTGGSWSSSSSAIASVDPVTGDVLGEASGFSATIYYTSLAGCSITTVVSVPLGTFPYSMSGDGIACSGTPGVDLMLIGSNPGVNYQLYNGTTPVGLPVTGTGLNVDFGYYAIAGTYSVVGTAGSGCPTPMGTTSTIIAAASPVAYNVTGSGSICIGAPGLAVGLDGSDVGIDYQLYNGAAAVGTATPGTGTALSFLTSITASTYTVVASDPTSGCTSNMAGAAIIHVNPLPVAFTLSGGGGYCSGTSGLSITLSSSESGVNYQVYDGIVSVGAPVPGTGSLITFGPYTGGTYTVVATNPSTGCTRTMTGSALISPTLLTPSVNIVSSSGTICTGSSVTFGADPVNGGATPTYTWIVNGSVVSTLSTYPYVPVNHDVITLKMISSLPCASPDSAKITDTLTVITPVITASSSSVCGGSEILSVGGGVSYSWAPATGLSCSTCDTATVDPSSTQVYTITGTDVYGCIGHTTVTADGNAIAGHITVTGIPAPGTIRVWLIQYSPADSSIMAVDSVMACMNGDIPYYSFKDKPAGTYYVKAAVLGGLPGASGYVATYGISSLHWDGANTVIHGSGTDTMHINMLYGIVSTGIGFISGFVYSGAGRGTLTTVPAVGMLVYLTDGPTGNVLTTAYTNVDGYYEFPRIAYGSYIVYPEVYHYYTTPAYVITLNDDHRAEANVDFKQHTNYGIITPYINEDVVKPISANNGISVFPNPTSGSVNIVWTSQQTGEGHVTVTDVVGREVYNAAIDINTANGQAQFNLSSLKNGIYMINVKSSGNTFSGKLMIQQ